MNNATRPTLNSMTSKNRCYYPHCAKSPTWEVMSSAKKLADGSYITALSCDGHYSALTTSLRKAGTRYTLSPIVVTRTIQPENEKYRSSVEDSYEKELAKFPLPVRIIVDGLSIIVMVCIAPFLIGYYGVKWLCGWRPNQ